MTKLNLEPQDLQIVRTILSKYPYQFYAFGSRVSGKSKKFSDLDLCYKQAIPFGVITEIAADFAGSDLPFKVDLIAWHDCTADFQQLIAKNMVEFIS